MGKLYFIYGCMSASKSAKLITDRYNFVQNGTDVVAIKPSIDTRVSEPVIKSRIGVSCPCLVRDILNWKEILSTAPIYMIDEIQFFKPKDIDNLVVLADDYDKIVFTYGLRGDMTSGMFPAAQRLIEVGAEMIELKTNCQIAGCIKPASQHLRFDKDGKVIKNGPQIMIDDGSITYRSVCRTHFHQHHR